MVRNGDGGVVIGDAAVNDDGRRVINYGGRVVIDDGCVSDDGRRVINLNRRVVSLGSRLRTPAPVGRVFI